MSRILLFVALLVAVAVALPVTSPKLQDLQRIATESEDARFKRDPYAGHGGFGGYGGHHGGFGGHRGGFGHGGFGHGGFGHGGFGHGGFGHGGFGHGGFGHGGFGYGRGCRGCGGPRYPGSFANSGASAAAINTPFGSGSFATSFGNSGGYGR